PVGRTGVLAAWAVRAPAGFAPPIRFLFAACAVVTASLVGAAINGALGADVLTTWLLVPSTIALLWRRRVRHVLTGVDAPERDLELLSVLLECIERQQFTSARLRALRDALATGQVMPSRRIAALARLMSWLDSTRNQFFGPIAALLLLRSQLAAAIDHWHASYGPANDRSRRRA